MNNILLSIIMLIVGGVGTSLFLLFRRGNKIDYSPEDYVRPTLNEEETNEVIEATYEALEKEHIQDEEFENKVTKIGDEIHNMPNDVLADYINGFFGTESETNPIACTEDKSKFEWETDDC